MPPVSLYVGGRDELVDGRKLCERLRTVEKDVVVMRCQIDGDYEHLDCLWSMDCVDRVAKNVVQDIWSTIPLSEDIFIPDTCVPPDKGKFSSTKETTQVS
jgi:hypothetical protein